VSLCHCIRWNSFLGAGFCLSPGRTERLRASAILGYEGVYGDLSLGSPEDARISKEQSAKNDVQR
jgi:hypothetical protein